MSNYASAPTTQQAVGNQQFSAPEHVMQSNAAGSANDYYQQAPQQYQSPGQGQNATSSPNGQANAYQQGGPTSNGQPGANGKPGGQQLGAGEPAGAAEQDGLHKFLDKVEKKFGGERFNNPDNHEKNQKLNDSIIKKLKQVGKIVMQKAPRMIMNAVR